MNFSDDPDVSVADPKHKTYVLQIEKALKAFENSTEWADLIAALGKLHKVFQNYGKFGFLPRKTIVAKRLAQCLHPALPSGVHSKTLETYKIIFEIIGHDKLASDLFLYSLGLYPLLGFATMSVKSTLLSLYETHFLPLGDKLAPSLSGFILALLPGVEEGTESFDRTSILLDNICHAVTPSCFYVNFWESVCLSSQLRLNAMLYLNGHVLPKNIVPADDIVPVKFINFLVSGVSCCLTDENMLVQRNALDFINQVLPLNRPSKSTSVLFPPDKLQLLSAALVTLSKRDMSLSRRVFAWMLVNPNLQNAQVVASSKMKGSSHNLVDLNSTDVEFTCSDEVKELITKAFFKLLDSNMSSETSSMTFPQLFRILVTFVEKRPVGEELSDRVILAYIHFMYSRSLSDASAGLKHCDVLFSNFGSTYIWQAMAAGFSLLCGKKNPQGDSQFGASVTRISSVEEWCRMVMYLLNGVSAQSFSATQHRQFPILLNTVLQQMKCSYSTISYEHLSVCCKLCTEIIGIMQKSSLTVVDDESQQTEIGKLIAESISSLQGLITSLIINRVFAGSFEACKRSVTDFLIAPISELKSSKETSIHKFADTEDTSPFIILLVHALNLLLELHSIPLPSSLSHELCKSLDQRNAASDEDADSSSVTFSPFLYAILAAISSRHSYSLQLVVINGLVDLLSLAYQNNGLQLNVSSPSVSESKSFDLGEDADPSVPCHTLNVIKPFHSHYLSFLEHETCLYEALTLILWSGIASRRPGCHEQSAELLFVLHQISPRPTLCEDVICRQLVSIDAAVRHEAFKRFARFWHISRGIDRRRVRRIRTFNRCLLVFLESLSRTNDQVYPVVIGWVEQVIRDNDLHSVMDPLFLLLLHPDTARIYIEKLVVISSDTSFAGSGSRDSAISDQQSVEDDAESRIVAVASENGQVRFMTAPIRPTSAATSQSSASTMIQLKNGKSVVSSKFGSGQSSKGSPPQTIPESKAIQASDSGQQSLFSLVTNPFEDAMVEHDNDDEASLGIDIVKRARRLEHGQIVDPQQESSRSTSAASIPSALDEFTDGMVDSLFRQVFLVVTGEDPEAAVEEPSPTPTIPSTGNGLEPYSVNLFATDVLGSSSKAVHPLASHLLVYYETFDTTRVSHAIKLISNLIMSSPQSLCIAMATTRLAAGEDSSSTAASFGDGGLCTTQSRQLRMLLAKHRCSLLGRNFYSDSTDQLSSAYSNLTYLELALHTLLHYMRSVHPVKDSTVGTDHLANMEVQIAAAHLLAVIVSNITRLLRLPQPPVAGFAEYITDVLAHTRLVNILLYCVGMSLALPYLSSNPANSSVAMKIATDALRQRASVVASDTQLVYHLKMLVLVRCCAELEMALAGCTPKLRAGFEKAPNWLPNRDPKSVKAVAEYVLRFHSDRPLVYQPLMLFSVRHVLGTRELAECHPAWLQLTISLLPSLCRGTSDYVTTTVASICSAMLWLTEAYAGSGKDSLNLPTDYLLTLLDSLSSLVNFTFSSDCSAATVRPIVNREFSMLSPSESMDPDGSGALAGDSSFQLHSAARRTFTWSNWFREKKSRKGLGAVALSETRAAFISCLPRLLLATSNLQRVCFKVAGQLDIAGFRPPIHLVASPEAILCRIVELMNPLTIHAPTNLMLSSAHVLSEFEAQQSTEKKQQQEPIVALLLTLKNLSFPIFADEVALAIKQTLEQKQQYSSGSNVANNLLLLFSAYMVADTHPHTVLVDGWSSVLALCRDCFATLPSIPLGVPVAPAMSDIRLWRLGLTAFEVLAKYIEIVQRDLDKKRQKEVQEIAQKGCEAVANIAGLLLESVTWFGRHYAVNQARQTSNHVLFSITLDALNLISEHAARLLDTIFDSNEKERAVNVISTMMNMVWPFLRDRTEANISHFTAASQFLANLAGFVYNRRVWKKEIFDLVSTFDSCLFQMPPSAFEHWKVICDALMTFERQTFKDFVLKMQSSLSNPMGSIFVNQDTEIQKRVAYLKRIAFVVFASDIDQYVRQLPEIQEKIAESLRYSDSPIILSNIFFLLRVILLRFSSDNLTPFWPVLFTEMSRVLVLLEKKSHDLATLQEIVVAKNAQIPTSPDTLTWLPAYLAAAKLLELILLMPRNSFVQFQLSRWAFVDNNAACLAVDLGSRINSSRPYSRALILRISQQMARLEQCRCSEVDVKNSPIIHWTQILAPHDLHLFFLYWASKPDISIGENVSRTVINDLESIVVWDFVEMLPRSSVPHGQSSMAQVNGNISKC